MEAERLIFKRLHQIHLQRFYEIHSDPVLPKYGYKPIDFKIANEVFEGLLKHWEEFGFGSWAVFEKNNPELLIGFGGIYNRMFNDGLIRTNLGIALDKDVWRQGYATEIAKTALDFAFNKLRLKEVFAMTERENHGAVNLVKKYGFQEIPNSDNIFRIKI